ncbi:SDR family oxidoreductase [Acidovorax sp. sif1233]|uniref:SDR family oxidoreductase n=1 Tax=Acidovorax sp. sif1233 TaxID=2854792 RepID=UPI001C457819|nr:SDR family oxidoreductase [Acidovorax sp. sif1233]MBV7458038.1 SDR family oxidoreductase [Acidovorax sp. sif1233]
MSSVPHTTLPAPGPAAASRVLAGKAAFVTGGARGIGAAIVRRLARDGAAVAFTYSSSEAPAQALVAAIEADGGKALALRADSADAQALAQAIDGAARTLGRLDILVNNAGVAVAGELDSFALADFDHTLDVNVRAVFVATQAAARHMGQGGAYGRVITIGSTNSDRVPWAGFSVYAMSKAAIVGLTKGLARDLGPRGITVNNVQPGPVNTDMNPADGPLAGSMHGLMALGRHAHPDEIAGMVAYLAGPESGMVTGASLLIDGGFAA